jgi:deoxyuridine 5'-triphosphate nucleotidohydrolase
MAKKNSIIKFTRTRDVKLPSRGHSHDAGIDFYVPQFDKDFVHDLKAKNKELLNPNRDGMGSGIILGTGPMPSAPNEQIDFQVTDINDTIIKYDESEDSLYFVLPPLNRVLIPSGIFCKMEEPGRALIAANKSGIASKHGIIFGAQVVDYEYQGEIHINVINTSSKSVRIHAGQKLIQFLETPIFTSNIVEVEGLSNLYSEGETTRGNKGFGSTNKK